MLKDRLDEIWQESHSDRKLTRATRAGLLDVSINTAERILNQQGNDRAVLVHAFQAVGLRWKDEFCVAREAGTEDGEAEEPQHEEPDPPRSVVVDLPRWYQKPIVIVLAIVAVAVLSGSIVRLRTPLADRQRPIVNRMVKQAWEAFYAGDYRRASTLANEATEISKRHSFADAMAESLRLRGDVLAAEGHLEAAVRTYREALPLWKTFEVHHGYYSLLEVLGVAEARLGWLDDAEKHFEESLRGLQRLKDPGGTAGLSRALGSVAALRGDHDHALHWYEVASQALASHPDDAMKTDLRALRALVLRDKGHDTEALRELEACLTFWRGRGHKRWCGTTLYQMATVHEEAGRTEKAHELLSEARALFEQAGDQRAVDQCTRPLASRNRAEDYF